MTSSLDATGSLALPLKLAADLVAASATFQTLVEAGSSAAALDRIFEGECIIEEFPRCVIDWRDRHIKKTVLTHWLLEGVIAVLIEKSVPQSSYETGYQDEGRIFRNEMGAIESEMIAALIASPHLYPNVTEIVGPIVQVPDPDNQQGEFVFAGWIGLKVEGSAL